PTWSSNQPVTPTKKLLSRFYCLAFSFASPEIQIFLDFQVCIAVYLSRIIPLDAETEKEGFEPSRRY
ncbi:MAG: hypothetical protein K6F35_05195, partial [Lachnospiraceae bacterium]|nr:hypothetical protein [Lachnospiraceae bacterium]